MRKKKALPRTRRGRDEEEDGPRVRIAERGP